MQVSRQKARAKAKVKSNAMRDVAISAASAAASGPPLELHCAILSSTPRLISGSHFVADYINYRTYETWYIKSRSATPLLTTPRRNIGAATILRLLEKDMQSEKNACDGLISPKYFQEEALAKSDILIVLYYIDAEGKNIKYAGVVIAKHRKKDFYIDVICSRKPEPENGDIHSGRMLLRIVDEVAAKLDLPEIRLHALPHVLGYYPAVGFEHRQSCSPSSPSVAISDTVRQFLSEKGITNQKIYKNKHAINFIYELYKHGYMKLVKETDPEECFGDSVAKTTIQTALCGTNFGFDMVKCLKYSPSQDTPKSAHPPTSKKAKAPLQLIPIDPLGPITPDIPSGQPPIRRRRPSSSPPAATGPDKRQKKQRVKAASRPVTRSSVQPTTRPVTRSSTRLATRRGDA